MSFTCITFNRMQFTYIFIVSTLRDKILDSDTKTAQNKPLGDWVDALLSLQSMINNHLYVAGVIIIS